MNFQTFSEIVIRSRGTASVFVSADLLGRDGPGRRARPGDPRVASSPVEAMRA